MFEDFSHEHLATASIGQVHEAKLNTGEKIAVKVQREGITDKVSIVALVSALFIGSSVVSFGPMVFDMPLISLIGYLIVIILSIIGLKKFVLK